MYQVDDLCNDKTGSVLYVICFVVVVADSLCFGHNWT